ncbi:MAG: hypothetical protein HRU43_02195 [Simkaniaceae bacterium]|nr:hypothetical protein [Simkaniaceae bacterium]
MDSADRVSKTCDTSQTPHDDGSFLRGSPTFSDGDFPIREGSLYDGLKEQPEIPLNVLS